MKIYDRSERGQEQSLTLSIYPDKLAIYLTALLADWITRIVAVAITVMVAIALVAGGLWAAYTYLPANVFSIIVVVLAADLLLGIVVRILVSRRK